jgi:hypothetical protein
MVRRSLLAEVEQALIFRVCGLKSSILASFPLGGPNPWYTAIAWCVSDSGHGPRLVGFLRVGHAAVFSILIVFRESAPG